jgi:Leu/Phe-tRNA-protein transferase
VRLVPEILLAVISPARICVAFVLEIAKKMRRDEKNKSFNVFINRQFD